MIYILIAVFSFSGRPAALSQEFNTKQACEAAAAEVIRQKDKSIGYASILFCAAKGEKK